MSSMMILRRYDMIYERHFSDYLTSFFFGYEKRINMAWSPGWMPLARLGRCHLVSGCRNNRCEQWPIQYIRGKRPRHREHSLSEHTSDNGNSICS